MAASTIDPLGYNLVNAVGTLRILEASRLVGARVIFASTQHVYRPSRGRLSERQTPNPQNVYGTSKLIAERWCEMYGATYGMSVSTLRLYSVYGPGQIGQGASGVVSIFAQAAMNNRTITVMSDQRRDFTHVSDVAKAVVTTIEKEPRGFNLYNIATGVGTAFRQLATQLIRITDSRSQVDDSGLVPAPGHLVPTIDRAAIELGFTTQITLAEGLKDYCERLRDPAVRSALRRVRLRTSLRIVLPRQEPRHGVYCPRGREGRARRCTYSREVRDSGVGEDFIWLVEGPVRSLDGEFFDITRHSQADRELINLLAEVSSQIGAQTINIHAISPRAMDSDCSETVRDEALDQGKAVVKRFEQACMQRGIRPTIENMPPVLRMRQGGFFICPIGLDPAEHLLRLIDAAPDVRVCLDYSHAQLYINASAMAAVGLGLEQFPALAAMLREAPSPANVTEYRRHSWRNAARLPCVKCQWSAG